MTGKKYVKYGILALVLVLAIVLVVFVIKGNRSEKNDLEIEGGLKSEETDEGQENIIDFEEVFGDQESESKTSEDGTGTEGDEAQEGDTQDGDAQNGDTQDGGTQGGNTQGSGTQGGNEQGGEKEDEVSDEDKKWGPLF